MMFNILRVMRIGYKLYNEVLMIYIKKGNAKNIHCLARTIQNFKKTTIFYFELSNLFQARGLNKQFTEHYHTLSSSNFIQIFLLKASKCSK